MFKAKKPSEVGFTDGSLTWRKIGSMMHGRANSLRPKTISSQYSNDYVFLWETPKLPPLEELKSNFWLVEYDRTQRPEVSVSRDGIITTSNYAGHYVIEATADRRVLNNSTYGKKPDKPSSLYSVQKLEIEGFQINEERVVKVFPETDYRGEMRYYREAIQMQDRWVKPFILQKNHRLQNESYTRWPESNHSPNGHYSKVALLTRAYWKRLRNSYPSLASFTVTGTEINDDGSVSAVMKALQLAAFVRSGGFRPGEMAALGSLNPYPRSALLRCALEKPVVLQRHARPLAGDTTLFEHMEGKNFPVFEVKVPLDIPFESTKVGKIVNDSEGGKVTVDLTSGEASYSPNLPEWFNTEPPIRKSMGVSFIVVPNKDEKD